MYSLFQACLSLVSRFLSWLITAKGRFFTGYCSCHCESIGLSVGIKSIDNFIGVAHAACIVFQRRHQAKIESILIFREFLIIAIISCEDTSISTPAGNCTICTIPISGIIFLPVYRTIGLNCVADYRS